VLRFSSAPPDKARPWETLHCWEQVCKPNSVLRFQSLRSQIWDLRDWNRSSDHSSSPFVAERIKRPTRRLRASSPVNAFLFGLAPRGVCLAAHVATRAGALLLLRSQISDLRSQ